ncbi:hypothetical protein FHS57_006248 [Runella defluvii]|uniref:DUF3179 domain-containing protein n=1 Tax=Runella defluvii TaxID=370973 RepID=A0A7W5ZVB5_9BACT|nr:hypothetical protein [Runella defluvii]MBB3842217.1 hypothetical protein [Runella defluvii]
MKFLKNLSIIGFVLLSIAAGASVAGPVGGLVGGTVAYGALQVSGIVELPYALFTGVKVGNIKRKDRREDDVLGGFQKMAIILPESFASHWPLASHITDGLISTAPTLLLNETFGQILFDLDKGTMKYSRKGEINSRNYQQDGDFTTSGVTDDQIAEMDKTGGGVLIIGWDNNGRRWLAGTTRRPLKLEYDVMLGSKPDDPVAIAAKFTRDGYRHGLLRIPDDIVLPLATLTGLD